MKRLAAAVLLFATVSSAQTHPPKKETRKTFLVFENADDIAGDRQGPMIDEIYVPNRRPGFKSLINVRDNFHDKLMQSVNEL